MLIPSATGATMNRFKLKSDLESMARFIKAIGIPQE
jgi:hypothetical protein